MKKVLLMLCLAYCTHGWSQAGYEIAVQLKPYSNQQVYLGYHYGKIKALYDSVLLDGNASGKFKGKDALPGGIYFLVSPSKQILFEILIDKDQHFSVSADSSKLPNDIQFLESPENKQFQHYSSYAAILGKEIADANNQLAQAKSSKDSSKLAELSRKNTFKLTHYRDSITKNYPESFLSALFLAMQDPKIPPVEEQPGGKYDSNFVYEYYKDHYWDNVSFTDNRLPRTPFFEARLERYFQDLVSPNPDSLKKEIDWMLLYSRTADEMYKYLMIHFVQKYINPQFMGQDAVFVHLFEKYINTGKADFFSKEYKEFTTRRAYSLMANLIGNPAAELNMVDTTGKATPLYKIQSDYTVICFWDPTCSHCKEVVPKVDSIYNAKWKNEGVSLYGVKTDGAKEEWTKFIRDNKLKGWHHVYQLPEEHEKEIKESRAGYKQLYDVYQTPLLYLLDKDKRIIAKKLTYLQIDEVINAKINANK